MSVSDIVLENFTPRVMARFGLDYASLRAVKPDLIMVSNTGYGHSGPWSNFGAMASALEPTHGTGAFMGYLDDDASGQLRPGNVPNKVGNSYTDFLATWTALASIMAALLHRSKTGRGTWIDLAMYQAGASFVGEGLLAYSYNGERVRRIGNRHQSMSPHGCYPCLGEDQWVTVAVRDDADWQAFCQAIDRADLAADSGFATARQRLARQDELRRHRIGLDAGAHFLPGDGHVASRRRASRPRADGPAGPRRSSLSPPGILREGGTPRGDGIGREGVHWPGLAVLGKQGGHCRACSTARRSQ